MKLRWIDLGIVESKLRASIWELDYLLNPKEPTIISLRLDRDVIQIFSNNIDANDYSKYNIPMIRTYNNKYKGDGVYYLGEYVISLICIIPVEYTIDDVISRIVYYYRKNKDVNSFYKHNGNDCLYISNGLQKKFAGTNKVDRTLVVDMSFKVNRYLIEKLFKKSNSIGEIYDILPNTNLEFDIESIIKLISDRFDFTMYKDEFTKDEYDIISSYGDRLLDNKWIYDRIHPIYGDVTI